MTDNTEALPPLPEPAIVPLETAWPYKPHFTADQMHAYARAALAQRQQVPEGWTDADADAARLALELECMLTDKDVPTSTVSRWWDSAHEALYLHRKRLAAAPALTAAPSAQAEPSQRQGCATTSESAEPKAKAEHTAEDRADNPERARRSASLGGAALAQAESQVPLPEFECASQYATKRGLAVSREWVRGWDACTDYIEELLRAHGIGKQEGK